MKRGNRLKVGDIVKVWWSNERTDGNWDQIVRIETPKQSMPYFTNGYRFAFFLGNKTGMTIPNDGVFEIRRGVREHAQITTREP